MTKTGRCFYQMLITAGFQHQKETGRKKILLKFDLKYRNKYGTNLILYLAFAILLW